MRGTEGRYRIEELIGIPEGDKVVYQDVGSTFSCELRGGDSEHIRPPAEAICQEEDVRTSSGRGRQGSKIVNADGYPRAVWQGDGEGRPSNGLVGGFPCLALEAAS